MQPNNIISVNVCDFLHSQFLLGSANVFTRPGRRSIWLRHYAHHCLPRSLHALHAHAAVCVLNLISLVIPPVCNTETVFSVPFLNGWIQLLSVNIFEPKRFHVSKTYRIVAEWFIVH